MTFGWLKGKIGYKAVIRCYAHHSLGRHIDGAFFMYGWMGVYYRAYFIYTFFLPEAVYKDHELPF